MEYLIRLLITLCGSAIVYLESLSTVAVVVIVLIFGSLAVGILLMPLMYGPLLVAHLSESIYPSRSGSRFLVIAGLSLLGSLIGFILGFSSYMVFGSGIAKATWIVSYGYCFICAVILFIFGAKHEEAEAFIQESPKPSEESEHVRNKVPHIMAVVFGILLIGSVGVNSWQYIVYSAEKEQLVTGYNELFSNYETTVADYDAQIADFEKKVKQLNRTIDSRDDEIRELNGKILRLNLDVNHMEPILDFYQKNAVFVVSGNKKYHTYGCLDIAGKTYWIYNVENAEYKGYRPCPKCR